MIKDNGGVVMIYTTLPGLDQAERMAQTLVTEKLAACVNVFPGMISIYEWQGKLERANEVACLIKTTRLKGPLTMDRIATLHPNETPAIVQFESDAAAGAFATWVAKQTTR